MSAVPAAVVSGRHAGARAVLGASTAMVDELTASGVPRMPAVTRQTVPASQDHLVVPAACALAGREVWP
jgi:hypothetical protein